MVKRELIKKTARKTGLTRSQVELVTNHLLETIREELESGGNVNLNKFGKFYIKKYPGREVITPQGKIIKINASNVPRFKPGRYFKDYCNQRVS